VTELKENNQLIPLDVRASEDQGADPMVASTVFDTRMPLNVNDDDIWSDMKEPPVEHEKCTEMTFDLVRYEIGGTIRLLSAADSATQSQLPEKQQYASLEAKDALLEKLRLRLEDKYLRHCDMSVPLQWVAANVSRLVMAKIWLVIHHPFRKANHGTKISQETRDRTFLTSIDVIRYSRMLWNQHKTSNWGWLFRTYFQWHAVAFLLSELCVRTTGDAVDEAWDVLTEALPEWEKEGFLQKKTLLLWKPIQKLIAKARRVRLEELARRDIFPTDGTLGVAPQWQLPNQQEQLQEQQAFVNRAQHSPSDNSMQSVSGSGAGGSGTGGRGSTVKTTPEPNMLGTSMDPQARCGQLPNLNSGANVGNGVGNGTGFTGTGGFTASGTTADDTAMQDLDTAPLADPQMAMWLNDPLLLDNDTWDANQTPWDNVGLDPDVAFANNDGMPLDFAQSLWSESGVGGTGF
jgi:hypothetical protein